MNIKRFYPSCRCGTVPCISDPNPHGILGNKFNKRLEYFASCDYSLLLVDFKENQTLLLCKKSSQKNLRNRKTLSIHETHFVERKNKSRKPDKNSSFRRLEFMREKKPTKNAVQEFHLCCTSNFKSLQFSQGLTRLKKGIS
jgi:hypothetical protein